MEVEKDTSGGTVASSSSSSSNYQSQRKRFYIELKPGETTIVSWKKLLNDSNNQINSSPPATELPAAPTEYIQEEKSRSRHSGFSVNPEKKEHLNESSKSADCQPKKRRNDIAEFLEEKDDVLVATKHKKLGHVRMKVAARNASCLGKESIQSQSLNALNDSIESNACASGSLAETRDINKIGVTTHSSNVGKDVKMLNDIPNAAHQKYEDKNDAQFVSQSGKLVCDINEEHSINIWHRDNGRNELPDLNLPYTDQPLKTAQTHLKDASNGGFKGTTLGRAILELEKMVAETIPVHINVQEADPSLAVKRRLPRELKQKLAKVARLAQSSQGKISDELINHLMSILGHWVQLRTLKRYLRDMVSEGLSASKEEDDRFRQIKKDVVEMIQLQTPSLKAKGREKCKRKKSSARPTDDILHGKASSVAHPQAISERLITDTSGLVLTSSDRILSSKP